MQLGCLQKSLSTYLVDLVYSPPPEMLTIQVFLARIDEADIKAPRTRRSRDPPSPVPDLPFSDDVDGDDEDEDKDDSDEDEDEEDSEDKAFIAPKDEDDEDA